MAAVLCRPVGGGVSFIVSILKAALTYFALVFGAGFVLGIVRTLWLVPFVRERTAEFIETPVMLIVVWLSARFIVGRLNEATQVRRLGIGTLALCLLLLAEWGVVRFLREQSMGEYVATRDPVSGAVYLLALVLFAAAPSLVGRKSGLPTG
jgi:hypothetical protein